VHIVCPITILAPADEQCIGLWLKKYNGGTATGTASLWIDNITFDGGIIPAHPNLPTLSITKPTNGLQCNFSGTAGNPAYDREMICTGNNTYSFVDAGSVTYSMNIASAPYNGSAAWIVFDQNNTQSEPDWNDPTVLALAISSPSPTGGSKVTEMMKSVSPNSNGQLYTSDPVFTNQSSVLGTWSFTFSNNTTIHCVAPDGSSTNLPIELGGVPLTSAQVETNFPTSGGMYVYFGAMGGGAANEGSRWVIANCSISGGTATPLSENWVAEANTGSGANGGEAGPAGSGGNTLPGRINPWTGTVSGVPWTDTSDSSTSRGLYLLGTNTPCVVSWTTLGGVGATVLTNTTVLPGTWGTNTVLTSQAFLDASYYSTEVDVTNLPPAAGDLFFELINSTSTQ
jgi:hypothetical protein